MSSTQPTPYDLFFAEVPPTDYLNDIEIQDEYEPTDYDTAQGLSDEQVLRIADDSRLKPADASPAPVMPVIEPTLFPQDSPL